MYTMFTHTLVFIALVVVALASPPAMPVTLKLHGVASTGYSATTGLCTVCVDVSIKGNYAYDGNVTLDVLARAHTAKYTGHDHIVRSTAHVGNVHHIRTHVPTCVELFSNMTYYTWFEAKLNGEVIGVQDTYIFIEDPYDVELIEPHIVTKRESDEREEYWEQQRLLGNESVHSEGGNSKRWLPGACQDCASGGPNCVTVRSNTYIYYTTLGGGIAGFPNVYVELYEDDAYFIDDCVAGGWTDSNGFVYLVGNTNFEALSYNFYLKIYLGHISFLVAGSPYRSDDNPYFILPYNITMQGFVNTPGLGDLYSTASSVDAWQYYVLGYTAPTTTTINFPAASTYVDTTNNAIYLESKYSGSPMVIAREFGKILLAALYGNPSMAQSTVDDRSLCPNGGQDFTLSYNEGYATAYSMIFISAMNSGYTGNGTFRWYTDSTVYDLEHFSCDITDPRQNEGRVAALIWDLYDSNMDSAANPTEGNVAYFDCNQDIALTARQVLITGVQGPSTGVFTVANLYASIGTRSVGLYVQSLLATLPQGNVIQTLNTIRYNYMLDGVLTISGTPTSYPQTFELGTSTGSYIYVYQSGTSNAFIPPVGSIVVYMTTSCGIWYTPILIDSMNLETIAPTRSSIAFTATYAQLILDPTHSVPSLTTAYIPFLAYV